MNAAASTRPAHEPAIHGSLKKPLIASGLFHLGLFLTTMIAIPFITKPIEIITPVSVELVGAIPDIKTSSPTPVPPKEIEESEPPKELLEPPKPPEPPPPEPESEPEVVEPVKEETPPPPKPKPKEEKPKEKEKEKEKPKEKSFDQLLKDFTPPDEKEKPKEKSDAKPDAPTEETSTIPDFARQLTLSEQDALDYSVGRCWKVDGGLRYAENLQPKLRVYLTDDMRVKDIQMLEPLRYNTDSAYRAMADSARRALLNPTCSKLDISPEKFKGLYFDFTFDARKMLGY